MLKVLLIIIYLFLVVHHLYSSNSNIRKYKKFIQSSIECIKLLKIVIVMDFWSMPIDGKYALLLHYCSQVFLQFFYTRYSPKRDMWILLSNAASQHYFSAKPHYWIEWILSYFGCYWADSYTCSLAMGGCF